MTRATLYGEKFKLCPFTVIVDSREQLPWSFRNFKCDSPHQERPLIITTKVKALKTGDYSIHGYEDRVCIERKSLADLYSTIGQNRERFVAEFERMLAFEFAALVIEADWLTICTSPPSHSKLHPKSVYRSLLAWSQRYNVHVHACSTPVFAEEMGFRLLERYWMDRQPGGVKYGN